MYSMLRTSNKTPDLLRLCYSFHQIKQYDLLHMRLYHIGPVECSCHLCTVSRAHILHNLVQTLDGVGSLLLASFYHLLQVSIEQVTPTTI